MAGKGETFEIEGLRFKKKRNAEENLYSAPKRHRPVVETSVSSKKTKIPLFSPSPFRHKHDYSQIEPSHRLGVLLSELLGQAEEHAKAVFYQFPRLLSIIASLLNTIETRCKERLYSYLNDRERLKQQLESSLTRQTVSQEDEKWRVWQHLLEKHPDTEAATEEVAYFSRVLAHIETAAVKPPMLPEMTAERVSYSIPMEDELSKAEYILRRDAEKRGVLTIDLSIRAAEEWADRKVRGKVEAHREFGALWPAIHTDPRKLLTNIARLQYRAEFDV